MNRTLLRAEWRAVRRASLRLTQQSLSMVGLLAVAAIALVVMHPEYARAVGRMILPRVVAPMPVTPVVNPLATVLTESGSEASRMLGLVEAASVASSPVADASATSRSPSASPSTPTTPAPRPVVADARPVSVREKRDAASYLSKKYHVNSDAVAMLVDAAYLTGRELNLDPLLLLSVIGVESGFNPFAESNAGASGLMQLMAKVHADKLGDFGGANIALNPVVNLRVGAIVLKDCIRRGGSIADGLRLYVGAGNGTDGGYGSRVLQEKDKLAQAVHATGRPRIEPIPATPAKSRAREPSIDHSFDNVDPGAIKLDASGRVAAL